MGGLLSNHDIHLPVKNSGWHTRGFSAPHQNTQRVLRGSLLSMRTPRLRTENCLPGRSPATCGWFCTSTARAFPGLMSHPGHLSGQHRHHTLPWRPAHPRRLAAHLATTPASLIFWVAFCKREDGRLQPQRRTGGRGLAGAWPREGVARVRAWPRGRMQFIGMNTAASSWYRTGTR